MFDSIFGKVMRFLNPGDLFWSEADKAITKNKAKAAAKKTAKETKKVLDDSGFNEILDNLTNAYKTSATQLEDTSTQDARKWFESREDLAYNRSVSSAKAQMEFQKEQNNLAWERSQSSAREQMAFQEKMWNKSVDYETEMANTQYQRLVNDLRKSGLNPVLAVNKGGSSVPNAVVPSGSSASAQAMTGASTSYSSNANLKSDFSSALSVDKKVDVLGLTLSAITSALKLLKF